LIERQASSQWISYELGKAFETCHILSRLVLFGKEGNPPNRI